MLHVPIGHDQIAGTHLDLDLAHLENGFTLQHEEGLLGLRVCVNTGISPGIILDEGHHSGFRIGLDFAGDMRLALNAIREKRGCLELLGKVTGELDGPEHTADHRPLFQLPEGSFPRITVDIPDDDVRELPAGD